jgi:hypothetical protein
MMARYRPCDSRGDKQLIADPIASQELLRTRPTTGTRTGWRAQPDVAGLLDQRYGDEEAR